MIFQIGPDAMDIRAIQHVVKGIDAGAQVIEHGTTQVRVLGDLLPSQVMPAFQRAGIAAQLVVDETAHVSGGTTCCGGCS